MGVVPRESDTTIYHVLSGAATMREARHNLTDRLSVIPSHLDLAAAEVELAGEVGRDAILRDRIRADDANFDFLIIDCAPSLGVLTLNALTAVKEVFLPLQPHFLALHGLSKLLQTIEIVSERLNPELQLTGVLLCLYESGTRLAAEVSSDAESFFSSQQGKHPAWGRRGGVSITNSTQHSLGRSTQLRPVDSRIRAAVAMVPTIIVSSPWKFWACPWNRASTRSHCTPRDVATSRVNSCFARWTRSFTRAQFVNYTPFFWPTLSTQARRRSRSDDCPRRDKSAISLRHRRAQVATDKRKTRL